MEDELRVLLWVFGFTEHLKCDCWTETYPSFKCDGRAVPQTLTCVNCSMPCLRFSMSWLYCSLRASISLSWHSTSSFSAPFRAVSSRSRWWSTSSWRWCSMAASASCACRFSTSCRERSDTSSQGHAEVRCWVCLLFYVVRTVWNESDWGTFSETLLSSSWSWASWSSWRHRRDSANSLDRRSAPSLQTNTPPQTRLSPTGQKTNETKLKQ